MREGFFLSSTCTEVSGVENIGQCCRLSQLSCLLGAFNIVTYLLAYLLTSDYVDCADNKRVYNESWLKTRNIHV